MISLFYSDVDRTLLASDYRLPDAVVEGCRNLRSRGVRLVLATARSPKGVLPIATAVHVDLAICFNGAWAGSVNGLKPLFESRLPRDIALSVMEVARDLSVSGMWYDSEEISVVEPDELVEREAEITGEQLVAVGRLDALPGRPFKIMCVGSRPHVDAFDRLKDRFSACCSVVMSNPRLLEITPLGTSKAMAARMIARELQIPREECAAAGDAENDLSLLGWVGRPLAVANAIPEIRKLAEFVGPSADDGGMAAVLEWVLR
jgi:Cof subfamily protein (haloacid dehalogenase superfamily)